MAEQSYATHRRYHPLYHFFAVPILAINLVWTVVRAFQHPSLESAWQVLVAAALSTIAALARFYPLKVQDRVIALEESLRLERRLPPELGSRVAELRRGQLIALRFCSDQELAEVVREVFDKKITRRDEIKRRIRMWRADSFRI